MTPVMGDEDGSSVKASAADESPLLAPPFPIVVSGPSGAGKTTLCRRLVERRSDVRFSVSATTRPPRSGEMEGADYQFLDRRSFEQLAERNELLEWAEVHGDLYGTPLAELEAARAEGKHLLLDIDVQGARSVRRRAPEALSIFLLPPTGARVLARLRKRGSEGDEELRHRMRTALAELRAASEFDHVVVNEELEIATAALESILCSERLRVARMQERVVARARELADEIERAFT